MDPNEEASNLLQQVIQGFTSANYDLVFIMRQCQHACELLGWTPTKIWFNYELNGYPIDTGLPSHRKINGVRKWEFEGSDFDEISFEMEKAERGLDPHVFSEEIDTLEVRAGVIWFLGTSKTGYREKLKETKEAPSPSGKKQIRLRRVRYFSNVNIAYNLSLIEKFVFDWASSSYVQLKYGNRVLNLWDKHRNIVDSALPKLGLTDHLAVIQENINKNNPEAWRTSVLECRNLLNDLANYLWRDPRSTYTHLKSSVPNEKLDVKQGNYSNRLSAYLHQKSITGTVGKFLRKDAERLSVSIRSLIEVASKAHEPIDRSLAEMVILWVYFLIGEIALKTDLEPISKYV
jgi:AbiTii